MEHTPEPEPHDAAGDVREEDQPAEEGGEEIQVEKFEDAAEDQPPAEEAPAEAAG